MNGENKSQTEHYVRRPSDEHLDPNVHLEMCLLLPSLPAYLSPQSQAQAPSLLVFSAYDL